jgi:hypothetical protein
MKFKRSSEGKKTKIRLALLLFRALLNLFKKVI